MKTLHLEGLIAAASTPFGANGGLNLQVVPRYTERLLTEGVAGIYVCGTTGEGLSLTNPERREVAEAYVAAAAGRIPVVVHVGHSSVEEAALLAAHANAAGADAIAAILPPHCPISSVATIVECLARIASGAPDLPFYYYHFPGYRGFDFDMVDFLKRAMERIPNFTGMKFTSPKVFEYQACLAATGDRLNILWGCDEMLLSALVVGARGAVGSTYGIAAPIYRQLWAAFLQGDLETARRCQQQSIDLVRTLYRYPYFPALKELLRLQGYDFGTCRLPQSVMTEEQRTCLRRNLTELSFLSLSGTRSV